MKNNQQNHNGTVLYLIQVKQFFSQLFQLLPSIGFLAPPLIEIARGIYGQQLNYAHTKIQAYADPIWHVWQCVHNGVQGEYSMNTL